MTDRIDRLQEAMVTPGAVARLSYHGLPRVVEVRDWRIGAAGDIQALVWQTGGASASGDLPGWRRMRVDVMRGVRVVKPRRSPDFVALPDPAVERSDVGQAGGVRFRKVRIVRRGG